MTWGSFADFIAMGGYAWYVWGSYDVTFVLIALELALVSVRHRAARRRFRGTSNESSRGGSEPGQHGAA